MSLELARQMVARREEQDWYGTDQSDAFVWAEHGNEVEQFNALAGAAAGGTDVFIVDEDEGYFSLSYRGKVEPVPVEFDRIDNLISVHTLSQLVKEDAELRMCSETGGNSEQAFMVLPPAQWAQLEQEFGAAAVKYCFIPMASTFDAFMDEAFSDENLHLEPEELSETDILVNAVADRIERLVVQRAIPCTIIRDEDIGYVSFVVLVDTDRERDRLTEDKEFIAALRPVLAALKVYCLTIECIGFDSHETAERDRNGLHLLVWVRNTAPHFWYNRRPPDAPQFGRPPGSA